MFWAGAEKCIKFGKIIIKFYCFLLRTKFKNRQLIMTSKEIIEELKRHSNLKDRWGWRGLVLILSMF